MSYEGPGIYQHYKGGHYRVLGVARHESAGSELVIYHSYDVEHDLDRFMDGVDFVARPRTSADGEDAFDDTVRPKDRDVPRFRLVKGVSS